jgi:serine/threonine-protein kinase
VIGTTVGTYRIIEQLGEGGMGVVYRATDTTLGRDVALKMLAGALPDAGQLARFDREARALASLNHPNIAAIYGLERSGSSAAIVMELIEGETLAARLRRGPLPIDEAIGVGVQVARAIDAAHQQGIIHRDLKPANISIRRDGSVKVLDFGLAKATAAGETSGDAATITRAPVTAAGVVVGTPAYMSPEQASGGPVDARTDIWSFGCVLYEMLTGRRLFGRNTSHETMAAIMSADPDWALLPGEVPAVVRVLLRRCLARDPRERLASMAAVVVLLEERRTLAADTAASGRAIAGTGSRRAVAALLLAVAAAAGAAATWWTLTRSRQAAAAITTMIPADAYFFGTERTFAVAPDGSRIVYAGSETSQIMVRPLAALEPVRLLASAANLRGVFLSPDAEWVGFVENNFTLRKVAAAGGPPMTVVQTDGPSRGAAWGTDGTIVFGTGASATGLQRVSVNGGPVTVLTRPDPSRGEADHVGPVWLPDGRGLLFTITARNGGVNAAKIAVLDVASGDIRIVLEGGYSPKPVGEYLVYGSAGKLRAIRFDAAARETTGASVEVLPEIRTGQAGLPAHFDVAANGTLVYLRDAPDPGDRVAIVWVDRQGRETAVDAPLDIYRHPRISPDGRHAAVAITGDIYVLDLQRRPVPVTRVTFDAATDWFPVWAPDGRGLLFASSRGGGFSNLYRQPLDSGEAERLTEGADMQLSTSVSPDGAALIFHTMTKSLQAVQIRSRETTTLVESPLEERNGEISPDGRWLAYDGESSKVPGQLDVYVQPYPNVNRGVWPVTREGGRFPMWSRDGRELFYIHPDNTMMAVPVEATATTWQNGAPVRLFRGRYLTNLEGTLARNHDVAPDGRFLMLKREAGRTDRGGPHFVVVQHWFIEVERLLQEAR